MNREYPRWVHHPNGRSVIVNGPEHEVAMGDGWYDSPVDFPAPEVAPEPPALLNEPADQPKVKGKPGPKPKVKE